MGQRLTGKHVAASRSGTMFRLRHIGADWRRDKVAEGVVTGFGRHPASGRAMFFLAWEAGSMCDYRDDWIVEGTAWAWAR